MSNRPTFTTVDEKSRESIVLDIDKNLFIEAGAGSGKTTMLVNRMIAMIESGIPVEKISAITFTKNAALEFYDRFQAKLINRSNPNNNDEPKRAGDLNKPTDITRQRCKTALENIDLCFMGTIDSFCNMILSEHPSEANIPSDARLISDEEACNIYKQFYLECRKGIYGNDIKTLANRFGMLFRNAEDSFAQLAKEIMDRRNINFIYDDKLCTDFFKCFKKDREDIKTVLSKFNEDKSKIILSSDDESKDPIIDIYDPANETLQKGWHYNYSGVEWSLKSIADLMYEGNCDSLGFNTESVVRDVEGGAKIALNINDKDNPDALLNKLQNYKYQNSLKFVLACVEPLQKKMREEGKFTFFDYLFILRNVLIEDSKKEGKLIEYIYNRHSYFLIDEFQDTNPLQAEIFFYLSAIDPKQKSWKDCKPKPGSLFIVGDPKQSIYRFRAADVSSYLNIKNMFDKSEVKYLVNNYRSKNELKSFYNDVFNKVMQNEEVDQSKYRDIENYNDAEQGDKIKEFRGLYKYESYSNTLLADYPNMADEIRLAEIINKLVNNPLYKIVGENGKLRNIKYNDFMVIVPAKKNIRKYLEEFDFQNIPTRVEGNVPFEGCSGLKTIVSIYKTVTDRNDIVSLISTLYSPVFGFNDNDLSAYRKQGGTVKLDFNKNYSNSGIEKALSTLVNTSKQIQNLTPSALYEKIMDDYEIFKYIPCDNSEIVYYVLELIRNEEHSGSIISFEDAYNFMNDLLQGKSGLERCLSLKQDVEAVHIANLHKVKGLEAPIVILTKAGTASTTPNIRVEYGDKEANGYVVKIKDDNYKGPHPIFLIETNDQKEKADEEKDSLKKENDRLVYVAATRAKNVLIVNVPKQQRGDKIINMANRWKQLVGDIEDDFFEQIEENDNYLDITQDEMIAEDIYEDYETTKINKEETYAYKQPSDIQFTSKTNESPYESEGLENGDSEKYATLIGTMVHRLMEMIIMSNDKISKDDAINNILTEYVDMELEDKKDYFKDILVNIYEVMHNGGYAQKGKAPQDILSVIKDSDKVYSEVPFTYKKDNDIWNGIIDLIYEKDGKLHIIDWKTNKNDEGLDEHYKDQLQAYVKATKVSLGKDVEDAVIYHIDCK